MGGEGARVRAAEVSWLSKSERWASHSCTEGVPRSEQGYAAGSGNAAHLAYQGREQPEEPRRGLAGLHHRLHHVAHVADPPLVVGADEGASPAEWEGDALRPHLHMLRRREQGVRCRERGAGRGERCGRLVLGDTEATERMLPHPDEPGRGRILLGNVVDHKGQAAGHRGVELAQELAQRLCAHHWRFVHHVLINDVGAHEGQCTLRIALQVRMG